jgi:hypothetical protein
VLASTLSELAGPVRTSAGLRLTVISNRMTEHFERSDDPRNHIEWERDGSTGTLPTASAKPRDE